MKSGYSPALRLQGQAAEHQEKTGVRPPSCPWGLQLGGSWAADGRCPTQPGGCRTVAAIELIPPPQSPGRVKSHRNDHDILSVQILRAGCRLQRDVMMHAADGEARTLSCLFLFWFCSPGGFSPEEELALILSSCRVTWGHSHHCQLLGYSGSWLGAPWVGLCRRSSVRGGGGRSCP